MKFLSQLKVRSFTGDTCIYDFSWETIEVSTNINYTDFRKVTKES